MTTPFRAYAAAAALIVDGVFTEPFTVVPMAYAGGKWTPDIERASVTVPAILTEMAAFESPIGQRNASGMSKGLVADVSASDARLEVLKSLIPYGVKAKDRFRRVADLVTFEVSGVLQDDLDHITYRLVRLG